MVSALEKPSSALPMDFLTSVKVSKYLILSKATPGRDHVVGCGSLGETKVCT